MTIYQSDILEYLKNYSGDPYHAVFGDAPYGIAFMGKQFDKFSSPQQFQAWVTEWASALLNVVYPGAVLALFGGSRTYHRLASGLEDAGWEIFDCLMYLYGSAMPKGHDISKNIDKQLGVERKVVGTAKGVGKQNPEWNGTAQGRKENYLKSEYPMTAPATPDAVRWDGWNVNLKPAFEPLVLARAPRKGLTFAQCALQFGSSALNIDGCRIEAKDSQLAEKFASVKNSPPRRNNVYGEDDSERNSVPNPAGRWPANLCLDEEAAAMLDEQSGILTSGGGDKGNKTVGAQGYGSNVRVYSTKDYEPNTGGASRFFYTSKASTFERLIPGEWTRTDHPTVKPLKLCSWLSTLLAPPPLDQPRRLLIPFSGVGSEMIGAHLSGMWEVVDGVEMEENYVRQAQARLDWWKQFSTYEDAKKAYDKREKKPQLVLY